MPFFKVRDLMINVIDDRLKLKGHGGMLCLEDQPTQLTCGRASPIMNALQLSPRIERAVGVATQLVRSGDPEGVPALREIAADIGMHLVAGATFGGGVAMPDPNCGGTSLETIPTPLTPVVHKGQMLELADLPSIKHRLRETLATIDRIENDFAVKPGLQADVAREHLQRAVESLSAKQR